MCGCSKQQPAEFHESLTYDFADVKPDSALAVGMQLELRPPLPPALPPTIFPPMPPLASRVEESLNHVSVPLPPLAAPLHRAIQGFKLPENRANRKERKAASVLCP